MTARRLSHCRNKFWSREFGAEPLPRVEMAPLEAASRGRAVTNFCRQDDYDIAKGLTQVDGLNYVPRAFGRP
jgi:hypothetical protein